MSVKKLKHFVPAWPDDLVWVSSYSGHDKLSPDPAKAVVREVKERDDHVSLTVQEGDRSFSVALAFPEAEHRRAVQATLEEARGFTLVEAGELEIQIDS